MDYRAELIEFYQKYNPDKLREIDLLLAKYRGREVELLHALKVKYGVHKTTPPAQQQPIVRPQSQPQPPPAPQQQEKQPPPKEQEKKVDQPVTSEEENRQSEGNRSSERHEGYQSYGTDKGRTAAERAEYWKKELERRERERSGAAKPSGSKFTSKGKEEYEAELEAEGEDEEGSSETSWFSVRKIAVIILMIVFICGVVFALLNDNIRTQFGSLLGFAKTELPKQDKKSGIDPNEITQTQDSAVNNPTGDFALDDEMDPEGEEASINNQTNSRKKPSVEEEEYVPEKKRVNDNPPKEEKVAGGLQTNNWYLSYITVSQEGAAKKAVRELQAQGYDNAGYYYIPDYDPRGKRLYKVYIGPFSTVETAERALDDNLRKISPGTYPYLLK